MRLIARLAVAAMCTSSAAAFDVAHVLHAADAIARRGHLLEIEQYQSSPNRRSWSAVTQAPPSFIPTQPEQEEIGKQ
jgi:hypothetical protein